MGIKFHPGLKAAGIDPSAVEKLIDLQKVPLESAKKRKDLTLKEKEAVEKLSTLLGELETASNGLKTPKEFYKLKLDSSHPDIIDGTIGEGAMIGTYELEVRSLARSDKELAYGFPDKDQTPIGFGYMMIRRDDGKEVELEIEPGTTLQGVSNKINDAHAGIKAMVINTKYDPDPYRLLVVSEKSGKEAKLFLDEDTTFLEFKEQVTGRNLDVLFEDVPVTNNENTLSEIIEGVSLTARRSEPGTRVQVSVVHDSDATFEGIKKFVEKYNEVSKFISGQFQENPETGERGVLAGDSTIKHVMRQLQSALLTPIKGEGKRSTLAELGITTNPKTGELNLDASKVKSAISEDYEGVASLFVKTDHSSGMAGVMAEKLKNFQDPGSGTVKSRLRGLDRVIKSQDQEIERRAKQLESKEDTIKRQFSKLETTLTDLQGQGDFLKARFASDNKQ